jgi:hypothetical protein
MKESITLKGHYRFTKRNIYTGEITGVYEYDNIIPTVGRSAIVNNIFNVAPTYDLLANYVALGSGTNVPANGDTTLQTEVYRNLVASRSEDNNIGYLTGFFSATETDGTYREAGVFMNATSIANSGVLLSRVAINITKSSSESLTVDWTFTIN